MNEYYIYFKFLGEYRIKIFVSENRHECERALLECEVLIAKMKTFAAELLSETYTEEKMKALGVIKNHIEMKKRSSQLNHTQLVSRLELIKSFGKEFEDQLAEYAELEETYKKKAWTLLKLKENNTIHDWRRFSWYFKQIIFTSYDLETC